MDKSMMRGIGIGLVCVPIVDVLRGLPLLGGYMTTVAVVGGVVLIVMSMTR